MKTFILPADLGAAIGEYLASRPYREVAGLLAALAQLEESKLPNLELPPRTASA